MAYFPDFGLQLSKSHPFPNEVKKDRKLTQVIVNWFYEHNKHMHFIQLTFLNLIVLRQIITSNYLNITLT